MTPEPQTLRFASADYTLLWLHLKGRICRARAEQGTLKGCNTGFGHHTGASLHLCMTPHGPDTATFERAISSSVSETPTFLPADNLAFMCGLFSHQLPPFSTASLPDFMIDALPLGHPHVYHTPTLFPLLTIIQYAPAPVLQVYREVEKVKSLQGQSSTIFRATTT